MANAKESGLWFLAVTCLLSCALFIVNQPIVGALFAWIATIWPELDDSKGVRQFVFFVGPIALLFVEWWLIDSLFRQRAQDDA